MVEITMQDPDRRPFQKIYTIGKQYKTDKQTQLNKITSLTDSNHMACQKGNKTIKLRAVILGAYQVYYSSFLVSIISNWGSSVD